jgi:hypothetical protein
MVASFQVSSFQFRFQLPLSKLPDARTFPSCGNLVALNTQIKGEANAVR